MLIHNVRSSRTPNSTRRRVVFKCQSLTHLCNNNIINEEADCGDGILLLNVTPKKKRKNSNSGMENFTSTKGSISIFILNYNEIKPIPIHINYNYQSLSFINQY
jgi:hypothetical protein